MIKKDFVKFHSVGYPTKYDKEKHIALIYDVFSEGEGVAAFLVEASISKQTFYNWLKAHKEFLSAYEAGSNISQRKWEQYPQNNSDFNYPHWSVIMRNRFGYGKSSVRIAKDTTPLARIEAIWKGLEKGELSTQEGTHLTSIVTSQANILATQPQEEEEFKLESKEELLKQIDKMQGSLDYMNYVKTIKEETNTKQV